MAANPVLRSADDNQNTDACWSIGNSCNPEQGLAITWEEKWHLPKVHRYHSFTMLSVAESSSQHSVVSTVCQKGFPFTARACTDKPCSWRCWILTVDAGDIEPSCVVSSHITCPS